MPFFPPRYDLLMVALSIFMATFASYVALDLAKRMRGSDHGFVRNWWIGGSAALGTGIWSMHFVGMLAFSIPVAIGYTPLLTFVSWCAAVAVSAVALAVAGQATLGPRRLMIGSATMGAGIFAMHYIGMAAIDMAPGIVWDPVLVAASLAIAVVASAVALQIFFWLRSASGGRGVGFQLLAAIVMGLAISGMHYTGMAAASFPTGSICLSAGALSGNELDTLVVSAAFALLSIALVTSVFDSRMQARTAQLAGSLQLAHAGLAREHERFRALTTLSSDWFWEHDASWRVTMLVNSVALTAGLPPEAYLGKSLAELGWLPVDVAQASEFYGRFKRREPYQDWEAQRADDDGRLHFISNSGAPIFDATGEFIGYRGVGRDITQRKRQERRALLQHTTTQLLADSRSVHDTLPEVIRGVCTSCHWAGGLFLADPAALRAASTQHWAEADAEAVVARIAEGSDAADRARGAAATGLCGSFTCPVRAGDQLFGTLEFYFKTPLDDAAPELDTVRGLALQLGDFIARCDAEALLRNERELLAQRVEERTRELSRINRELEIAKVGAEDASRAKSAFLATMSHEIRTPMNGVIGMIEVLEQSGLGSDQIDVVGTIRSSAFSLLGLIDDILDFSKIEAGELALERTPVALAGLVAEVCEFLARDAAAKDVELRCAVAADVPDYVWSDPTRLRQALANLIGNAVKFSAGRAHVRGRVDVSVERAPDASGRIALKIADNGIGIAAETLGKLFKPFVQAEASTTRRFGGTGLGLVICQRLATLMGGAIDVRSEVGLGSTFTLTLPMQEVVDVAADASVAGFATRASARPGEGLPAIAIGVKRAPAPSIAAARSAGRLILVAEDDLVNQKVVLRQLALLGCAAEVAGDGVEALRLWRSGGHGLVLTDLHMPELDGHGLAQAIRADEASAGSVSRIPILALTANALRDEASRVRDAGMDEYLTKPIQLATLGAALARWLPQARQAAIGSTLVAPSRAASAQRVVDVSVLRELIGDDDATVREFLAEFLQAARGQAAEIIASCVAEDHGRVGSVAHKLKASSRSVGALALGDLCAELENAGRSGNRAEIVAGRARFEQAMEAVDACIVEQLAESGA